MGGSNESTFISSARRLVICVRPRGRIESCLSAAVLRINPGAGFRTILIFEPSVGVRNRHAVNGFYSAILARWRRAFSTGNFSLCSDRSRNETGNSCEEQEQNQWE